MIAHSHLVSPFWALVWIVAKGVAQSAPVHTNRMAAQSISFLALMVGVSSTSWQEGPPTPSSFLYPTRMLSSCYCSGEWAVPGRAFLKLHLPLPQCVLPAL